MSYEAPCLLVASPALLDPNFLHVVVLIVEHDEEGALGLVLNRPLPLPLAQVCEEGGMNYRGPVEATAWRGGPVDPQRGILLVQGGLPEEEDTVVDLKRAPKTIGSDRLSFGNEGLLYETLGLTPGSVTALGLINDPDRRVTFILDKALWEADIVNFHPLTNTATTGLAQLDFRRFLSLIGREPMLVDFGQLGD